MKYRKLGRLGPTVSDIGFGAWAIGKSWWGPQDDAESLRSLHQAADLGVTFIDTAEVYGGGHSETIIGRFLKERRETITVATKTPPEKGLWPPSPYSHWSEAYSEAYLRRNVEQRLRNLGMDCLDVLQLHTWTRAWNRDPGPLAALAKLKEEGKIRQVGISTPEQDQNSVNGPIRDGLLDTVQVIFNLFEQEPAAETLPLALEKGVGVIVRVVFEEGALTGKFTADTTWPEGDFRREYFRGERLGRVLTRVDRIREDLRETGYSLPQAALRFALDHPAVSTVIPGMRSPTQAQANTAVSDLEPLPQELQEKLRRHIWRRGVWYPDHW